MSKERPPFRKRRLPKSTRQGNIFFALKRTIIITFFIVSAVVIGVTFLFFLLNYTGIPPKYLILIAIFYTIITAIAGIVLNIFIEIPTIASAYDEIKNAIAKKEIQSPEVFSEEVSKLMCRFFNFPFFTIDYAFMKVTQFDYGYSSSDVVDFIDGVEFEKLLSESKEKEESSFQGVIEIKKKKYYTYLIPIWFGAEWYGYLAVLTNTKLPAIFRAFLNSFEDDYLDDQLIHVLSLVKQRTQKELYREMNTLSNKIAKRGYTSLGEYKKEVLNLLVQKTNSLGGVFLSVYQEEPLYVFAKEDKIEKDIRKYFKKSIATTREVKIYDDPNVEVKWTYRMPILIDSLKGIIFLFSNDRTKFDFFDSILREIEDIKIDNDLENLAMQLNSHPIDKPIIYLEGTTS